MVVFEFTVAASERVESSKLLEQLLIDQLFSELEVKSVGSTLADLFSEVAEQVEECLEDSGVLDQG